MKTYLLSLTIVLSLSIKVEAQSQEEELKQSVSRMTYAAGDRRIIKLNGELEALREVSKSKAKKTKVKPYPEITVQCSPIGLAETIGVLPKKKNKYEPKAYGEEIDIDAPQSLNIPDEKWRRIAELACLEDEI